MNKRLKDVVFSVCGLLVMRMGNKALTQKWVNKVEEKDVNDDAMLEWSNQ